MNTECRFAATLSASALLVGAAFVSAPAASAEPTVQSEIAASAAADDGNDFLVNWWYQDFLDRYADDGAEGWVTALDAGVTPADVTWAITHSPEYHGKELNRIYQLYLNRLPEYREKYWLDGLDSRRYPVEWVAQNILASPEYAERGNAEAVSGWYLQLLGRTTDVSRGEVGYWTSRIKQVGRFTALREFYYAPETVRVRINASYQKLLLRDAESGGLSYWFDKEVESDVNVQVLIANSDEYKAVQTR